MGGGIVVQKCSWRPRLTFPGSQRGGAERAGAISKPLFCGLKTVAMRQVKLIISRSPARLPTIATSRASPPLTTSDLPGSAEPIQPRSKKKSRLFFPPCAFTSKGAMCDSLGVGRQLALDSMKALAIHSSFWLPDRAIIKRGFYCGVRLETRGEAEPL